MCVEEKFSLLNVWNIKGLSTLTTNVFCTVPCTVYTMYMCIYYVVELHLQRTSHFDFK